MGVRRKASRGGAVGVQCGHTCLQINVKLFAPGSLRNL